jgi:hypothetical protein
MPKANKIHPELKGLPNKVLVNSTTYKINLIHKPKHEDGSEPYGWCNRGKKKEIVLDSDPEINANMCEVVLHEIYHAIWEEYGFLTHKKLTEEQMVNGLGAAFTATMMHNPKLNDYFNKQWKKK